MSDEKYFTVRITFRETLAPDRIVETEEYAPDAMTAVAIAASRHSGYWKDVRYATAKERADR